jgi:hypothetical protein
MSNFKIKFVDSKFCYEIQKLNISIWNKEELPEEWSESIILPTCFIALHKKGDKTDKTDCSN